VEGCSTVSGLHHHYITLLQCLIITSLTSPYKGTDVHEIPLFCSIMSFWLGVCRSIFESSWFGYLQELLILMWFGTGFFQTPHRWCSSGWKDVKCQSIMAQFFQLLANSIKCSMLFIFFVWFKTLSVSSLSYLLSTFLYYTLCRYFVVFAYSYIFIWYVSWYRQLDDVISNLCKNFAEGTEYFKVVFLRLWPSIFHHSCVVYIMG